MTACLKNWPDQRVLVTGGAGFIGSALTWALNRRGCDNIVVCDILGTNEKWRNLTPLRFGDYVEAADLLPRLQSGDGRGLDASTAGLLERLVRR